MTNADLVPSSSPPEPPFDELYARYVEFQRKARAHFMSLEQGDPDGEELIATLLATKSPDDLRRQLTEMSVVARQEFVRACRIGFKATMEERERPGVESEADKAWKTFVEL